MTNNHIFSDLPSAALTILPMAMPNAVTLFSA